MADVQSGTVTSSEKLNLENAKRVINEAKDAMDRDVDIAATFIRERPIACLAAALALGYVVGKIVSH
jgi:ElaB/YqjD/DUF883 family membrane-anchored ribosome-binding protein